MTTARRNLLKERYGPGLWEDQDGNLHWSIPEVLKELEVEDTPENRMICADMVKQIVREQCPEATIVERETPD